MASRQWIVGLLLIFSWSAVGLNLPEVYTPVMKATVGMNDWGYTTLPTLEEPELRPENDWHEAYNIGNATFQREASERGIEPYEPDRIRWMPTYGLFRLQWRTSRDVGESARTTLYFHADTKQVAYFGAPTGERLGNTITIWLYQLHFAGLGGLPYRILVSVLGLRIALLSASGVYIWWKKRQSRVSQKASTRSDARAELFRQTSHFVIEESPQGQPGQQLEEPVS